MAKKTGYIVTETNFEYNDEYYSQQEGGSPIKVYMTREVAEHEAMKLEIKTLRQNYFRYSDYVNENAGHSADSDENFLKEYFKIIKASKKKEALAEPLSVTHARDLLRADIRVKWNGPKGNGDLTISAAEVLGMKKVIEQNNATLTVKGKPTTMFNIQNAAGVIEEFEAKKEEEEETFSDDLWAARDLVKFDKLTDEQLIDLIPLMPIKFHDVAPIEIGD